MRLPVLTAIAMVLALSVTAAMADPGGVEQAPTVGTAVPPQATVPEPVKAAAKADEQSGRDIRVQIVAESSAVIGAPMSGLLQEFPLRDGDSFEKGALLARFACDEQQAALAHGRAVLSGKKAMLASSQKLKQLGTGSALDYDVSVAGVAEAQADIEIASARLRPCTVNAPFSGRVAAISVRNHQFVPVGAPLLDIVGDAALEAQMIVPSKWLTFVKTGLGFDLDVDETRHRYHAEITRISGRVDPVSQSVKVYAKIKDATPDLLAGMSGRALIAPAAGSN